MIPNDTPQTLETVGEAVAHVGQYRITEANQARILVSLSDKMYTRKELAVVREYSNNGNDAHIVAGKPTSELIVTLPTFENLMFKVRDFGSGLTREDIRDVYCVLGESKKRNSPEQNGVLGYGCKAGFAHADSFTVTSWINGEKTIYNCIKGDVVKLPSVIELSRCSSDEPSGIEVCIPVKQGSLWTFHSEAVNFFKYWENLPTFINLSDDDRESIESFRNTSPTLSGDGWSIRPKCDGSAVGVAFMGGVPYRIDWNMLGSKMALTSHRRVLFDLFQNNDVLLTFKMGEIQFVDSREGLEYTDKTIAAMLSRIESMFDKIKDSIQDKFTNIPNIWAAKMVYNAIFSTGKLEVEAGEDDSATFEKIRILDGNLTRLESCFQGIFTWNGIPINGAGFPLINRFDNNDPYKIQDNSHNPTYPVMTTYRKKKNRTKVLRCTEHYANNIVASNRVVVVINDSGTKSGQSVIARYLIFKNNSPYSVVHILNFVNSDIKDAFYKEYGFDTVPCLKFSEIIGDAKIWNKEHKVSRSYSTGGGGGGGSKSLTYIDVATGSVVEADVPLRELEDGGYFVYIGKSRRKITRIKLADNYTSVHPDNVIRHIQVLSEAMDADVDRVYIIGSLTANSKWFTEATQSGDWINLWKHFSENLSQIENYDKLAEVQDLEEHRIFSKRVVGIILPLIMDKKSEIIKLIEKYNEFDKFNFNKVLNALGATNLTIPNQKQVGTPFEILHDNIRKQYPFLQSYKDEYVTEDRLKEVAKYINAMDLFVDLTTDNTSKVEESPKEQVEVVA
jgi:hypothetical protein